MKAITVLFVTLLVVSLGATAMASDAKHSVGLAPQSLAHDRAIVEPNNNPPVDATVGHMWAIDLNAGIWDMNDTDLGSGLLTSVGGPGTGDFIPAGDVDAAGTTMYMVDHLCNLWSGDVATGVNTLITGGVCANGAELWSGITYCEDDDTWYAVATDITVSSLYTVDVVTGAVTTIGITGAPGLIDVAAHGGVLYAFDIVTDSFYTIDKGTGIATLVGPLGFDANFAQGMDVDPDDGTVYLAAFDNGTFQGELKTVDTGTGLATLVGVLGYGAAGDWVEGTAFGIPGTGGDPCDVCDLTTFQAKCVDEGGGTWNIKFRLVAFGTVIEDCPDVVFDVNGTEYVRPWQTNGTHSRALHQLFGQPAGVYTVSLVSPADCHDPIVLACGVGGQPSGEWEDLDLGFEGDTPENMALNTVPVQTELIGNYPNPFNPTTTISYALANEGFVSLKIYNTLGQEVATLVNEFQAAGTFQATWNGTNDFGAAVSSGIYLYRLQTNDVVVTEKMMFMK